MKSLRICLLFLTFVWVTMPINCQYNEGEEEYKSGEGKRKVEKEEIREELQKLLDILGLVLTETLRPHLNCSAEASIGIEYCVFNNSVEFIFENVTEEDLCRLGEHFLQCFEVGFGKCNSIKTSAAQTKYQQDVKKAVQPDEGDCEKYLLPFSTTTSILRKIKTTFQSSTELFVTSDMTHTLNLNNSMKTVTTLRPKKASSRARQINARNKINLAICILPIISVFLSF